MTTSKRAIVTGAAGFIGSHLTRTLTRDGWSVLAIDNGRSGDWSRLDVECERLDRDIVSISADEFSQLASGAEVVFHLAAEKYNSSRTTPERVVDTNVSAMIRLLDGAGRAGVRKTVFTSSLYAYGSLGPSPMRESDVPSPTTYYGISKLAGEHLLEVERRRSGMAWAAARLFFVFGTHQFAEGGYKSVIINNFERMRRGERPIILGDGQQALDYIHISDVVAALIALSAPDRDSVLVNVGSGRGRTIVEITREMCVVAGEPYDPEFQPPDWTAGSRRVADTDLMAGMGIAAPTTLRDGLEELWAWMADRDG